MEWIRHDFDRYSVVVVWDLEEPWVGKRLLSAISVVITSQVVCPPGGGEGSVQADEAGHVPDPGIQHRQHTLVIVAHPSPEKGYTSTSGSIISTKATF